MAAAGTATDATRDYLKALDRMMVDLAPISAESSAVIRQAYRDHLELLVLDEFAALEDALATGGLVPLPGDAARYNLRPRTDGPAPIAEKDLANQARYISARPATIGALLEIASRVRTGPLEITSLVRHRDYQESLRATNANANTAVPMHTMGLAIDIALVNTPLATVYEIRDVLRRMQADGDILFIGERRQLVFHVVPHPARLGYFSDRYTRIVAGTAAGPQTIASMPLGAVLSPYPRALVETQVISIQPTADHAAEWWSTDDVPADVTIEVSPAAFDAGIGDRWSLRQLAGQCATIVHAMWSAARALVA